MTLREYANVLVMPYLLSMYCQRCWISVTVQSTSVTSMTVYFSRTAHYSIQYIVRCTTVTLKFNSVVQWQWRQCM